MEEPCLVPDYYPAFSCKMGACRHACCEGWPISISMKDYFHLLSLDCSPELRRRLDAGLHLSLHPTEDAYAQILPNYTGACPLHMEDGRCALHAECGGDALALVCRLYPRGMRTGPHKECSCANSCEAVLELFLHREAPLTFITHPQEIPLPDVPRRHHFNAGAQEQEIRLWLISMLQRREYPLAQRMLLLGQALHAMEQALDAQDSAAVAALLNGQTMIPAPVMPVPSHEKLVSALAATEHMAEAMRHSVSIRDYVDAASRSLHTGSGLYEAHAAAQRRLASILPQWETWLEHMLINHMFFVQFPLQDRPIPLKDEYLALVAVYVLLRWLLLGCLTDADNTTSAVDIAAAAFRLVDHTAFDLYVPSLLKEHGYADWAAIRLLLSL